MNLYEKVYTESLKDVIGNDPVLDQFDIFYEASYYGSSQDDYITGSLLNVTIDPAGLKQYLTGTRGRSFSKLYASSEPPVPQTYGSEIVNRIPSLSYRFVPASSKVSRTAYRIAQCFDESERYYDSCLPSLKESFDFANAKIWTIDNVSNAFSPYANVTTSSVGYMLFDSLEIDRTEDNFFENDPTVFNGWTRSFPYDGKYSTLPRLSSANDLLNLDESSLVVDWNIPHHGDLLIAETEPSFLGPRLVKLYKDNTVVREEDINIDNVRQTRKTKITSFIPVIPGYLETNGSDSFRNGLRSKTTVAGGYGNVPVHMGSYKNTGLDKETGYSLLLLGDVDLSKKVDHTSYLSSFPSVTDPGLEYLTSSAGTSDLIKFMFGFGDLNNVTYGRRVFDSTKKTLRYEESFENYSQGTIAYNLSNYKDEFFELNWDTFSIGTYNTLKPWRVATTDGTFVNGLDSLTYNFKSGSSPGSTSRGVKWLSKNSDKNIFVSATSKIKASPFEVPSGSMEQDISVFFIDVTASYPWSFSFDRALYGNSSDTLTTSVAGFPGLPSSVGTGIFPFIVVDQITGSNGSLKTLETYDYTTDGFYETGTSVYNKDYPLPPGEWRIGWQFSSGSTAPPAGTSFAAVNNIKFHAYDSLEKTSMIGSNNLPQFSYKAVDSRYNPTILTSPLTEGGYIFSSEASNAYVTSSAGTYSSYVFGVNPVIRGWKYGLVNGFPENTKMIFRRGHYGQFRDILEQRKYTRFLATGLSPTDLDAITVNGFDKTWMSTLASSKNASPYVNLIGEGAISVKFVHKVPNITPSGVGTIETRYVPPELTTSQNLSPYVTSSLPYFDGEPRHRSQSEMETINRVSFVEQSTSVVTTP